LRSNVKDSFCTVFSSVNFRSFPSICSSERTYTYLHRNRGAFSPSYMPFTANGDAKATAVAQAELTDRRI
jgi:hypothetical protein